MAVRHRATDPKAGFTLLELLIVVVVISILATIAIPKFNEVRLKAHLSSVIADARILYTGLEEFHAKNMMYPNASSSPAFDIVTFEPLRSAVDYQGHVNARLQGGQADAYDSPDDQGPNQEFWIQMSLRIDPTYQVVLAISDDAPLAGGRWLQGVYWYKDGNLIGGPGT